MNDFFKFRSATLPKDSFVKTNTNKTFMIKMTIKNGKDIFRRNKGIVIEKAEVANTHEKIIFFKLRELMD